MVEQKMFEKHLILVLTLLSLALFQSSALAANGLIGSAAPNFRVQSGDDKELTLDMNKGKVVAIFYENKDVVENNKQVKDALNKLYYEQTDVLKDVLVRLPIIDCSDAIWPFLGIWKRRLREHSRKEGVVIYGDWNGKMSSDYRMKADVSNIVIVDKSGRIRFFTSGVVKAEEIDGVKQLLILLAAE
jgi:predicted transcriptional regulator